MRRLISKGTPPRTEWFMAERLEFVGRIWQVYLHTKPLQKGSVAYSLSKAHQAIFLNRIICKNILPILFLHLSCCSWREVESFFP